MPLDVVDFLQFGILGNRLNALLQRNDLVVASHDRHGRDFPFPVAERPDFGRRAVEDGDGVRSELADEATHFVMIAYEEDLQRLGAGTEEYPNFQPRPAFKDILPQPADRDSRVKMRLAKAVRKDSQCLFRPVDIRVAQLFEGGEKARADQDDGFRRHKEINMAR